MKIRKVLVAALLLVSILALTVASQINPVNNLVSKISQVTPTISLEEREQCTTSFYDEIKPLIGNCVYYNNYTGCLNTSGPNTACSLQQTQINIGCKIGETIITRNTTKCKPDNNFIISINQGTAVLKKQLDYSEWGPCIYEAKNNCLVVTCVSLYDGAHKGKFTDCRGGKSCQRFEICDNSIRTFYKNSREDFVEYDATFYLPRLVLNEVGQ